MKLICLLALLISIPPAFAQNATDPDDSPFEDKKDHKRFWNGSLPGGNYLVALDRIANVSKHRYLLDGTLVVTEVTIDTVGNSLARFYHITPAAENSNLASPRKVLERANDLLERAGQRTGSDLAEMVHKKYPVTTHAKTIEFRVMDLGTLDALYGSVTSAWVSGHGRRFRVR
ncbi:MAG: hypothetical protein HKN82_17465 [Akkermansiaceae bacterium]|nr:hypothetical protein [Akkermansiaceae bacterium]NNM30490.1 hypothetical protein [Akkermansiaceae bacterium]